MLLTEISPQFHGTSWYPGRLWSRLPSRLFDGSISRADIDIFQTDSYRTDDIFPTQQARLAASDVAHCSLFVYWEYDVL